MALTITHAKTNDIADWTQADLDAQIALGNYPPGTVLADIVLPSDWNSNHTLSGSIAWGEITGTLSSQTDLQTALDGKQSTGNYITALTGDVTASGPGSAAATLATVNANTGSFGSATAAPTFTVNGKGLITAAGSVTITPAIGNVTGLGTNVATALGVSVGTAGAFVVNGGALGTPSSGVATNLTGTASGLTAGTVTTNANLTGPITSVGNATSIASQTGTGTTFAMSAGPTFTGTVSVPGSNFTVGASVPFSDTAGTLTLQNVDAIDATTESTIEAAIDTLANLTSVQGQTISLSAPLTVPADPNADRLFFWDDSAGATTWLTLGTNLSITGTTLNASGTGGSSNSFETIAVSGQSNVVATSATDTLTLVAGSNITITTNAGTDTITIAASGGGSGLTRGVINMAVLGAVM